VPELPEVEVVRRGLAQWVTGREIASVDVLHPRAVRRHDAGSQDFAQRLTHRRIEAVSRRGKYLWCRLDDDFAMVGHLGMSGQLLMLTPGAPDEKHLRVRIAFADGGPELRFVDQRTFGGLAIASMVPDDAGGLVPDTIAHISRDLMDPGLDLDRVVRVVRQRQSGIKRVLLDQQVASGIGNIYADEALWRVQVHGERAADRLTAKQVRRVFRSASEVMDEALEQGGTSFDSLYVNVNGESGYFDRRLNAYGREGEPCPRCGTAIRRSAFMNRSSFWCPRCQPAPRARARQHSRDG